MITIIAGSRGIVSLSPVRKAMEMSAFEITEIISGGCPRCPDEAAIDIANIDGTPYRVMPAAWKRPDGSTDRSAGMKRNHAMGDIADALVAVWDGHSSGTMDMIDYMNSLGKLVFIYNTETELTVWYNLTETMKDGFEDGIKICN